MSDYHPPQQTVSGRILTSAGWLEGSLHLAKLHSLAEYLSHHAWYPMTDVVLARVGTMPFFALRRDETLLVSTHQPPPKESLPSPRTQNEKPAAWSQSGVPRMLLVKNVPLASLSNLNCTACPSCPGTTSAVPPALGRLNLSWSIVAMTSSE